MAEIRTVGGSVIAEVYGDLVRKSSLWGNDAIVQIDRDNIRRFGTGEHLATISGNSIRSAFGGTLLAEIQNGNEIRNPFNSELLYVINGHASPQEKAGLAATALILDERLK